jgi:hypothetical protein
MAGKTFPGIGDLEDEEPPLDAADAADSAGSAAFYSGPTVVDEAKVEQGLKKLRSLDAPPGPQTGIHQAVADAIADPARVTPKVPADAAPLIPEITVDPSRGTAVGRSVSGPLPGQQTTKPFDDKHLRGTMFGHGVHLPDIEPARRAEEVDTSKALAVVERGKPTNQDIAIFQPGPYAHYKATPTANAPSPPYPRQSRFYRTPIEVQPLPPRRKIIWRVIAAAACMGLIVVAALLWVRANTDDLSAPPRPAGVPAARPLDLHPLTEPPPTPPEVPAAAPPEAHLPATAAPPAVPAPAPAAARPRPTADRNDEAVAPPPPAARPKPAAVIPSVATHHTRPAAKRHNEAGAEGSGKPDQGDKSDGKPAGKSDAVEAKPTRAKRPVEEDPDATMAPTIE